MKRLCVHWPRFGPYHIARLRAAHTFLADRGVELIGLETAGSDSIYAWDPIEAGDAFRWVRVFPERGHTDISPPEMYTAVTRTLDRLQPDAVAICSYSLPDARACIAWCRRNRRAAILMMDSKEDDAVRSGVREALKTTIMSLFDAAFINGAPQKAYCIKLGMPPERVFTGHGVVDNDYFRQKAAEVRLHREKYRHLPGLEDDRPFFLASNRFIPRKNLAGLLRAYQFYRSRTAHPWKLVLLGDGPERARLETVVESERIADVTLAGFRQIDEIPVYYGLAGAFVHPAVAEQWGLVVNEAMAAGLPVLVSRTAGCAKDLVRPGENGYLFDPNDTEDMAGSLLRTAESSQREAMGRRSLEIISEWSPNRFASGLWNATQAAVEVSNRPFNPAGRMLLWGIQRASRRVTSFHFVRD